MDVPSLSPAVPARPCTGRLTPGGQPRHPRPAGVRTALGQECAFDYGYPPGRSLDLAPLLDAVAATYDGCAHCIEHQVLVAAADPAMTVQFVGVALLALSPFGAQAPVGLLVDRLRDSGAGIALTLRCRGIREAVDLAAAMSVEQRRAIAAVSVSVMLPRSWYDYPPGNRYAASIERLGRVDDQRELDRLYEIGVLPGSPR